MKQICNFCKGSGKLNISNDSEKKEIVCSKCNGNGSIQALLATHNTMVSTKKIIRK